MTTSMAARRRVTLLLAAVGTTLATAAPAFGLAANTPQVNLSRAVVSGNVVHLQPLVSHTSGPFTLYVDIGTGNIGPDVIAHFTRTLPATATSDWTALDIPWTAPASLTAGWACVVISAEHDYGRDTSPNSCTRFTIERLPRDTAAPVVTAGAAVAGSAGSTVRIPFAVRDDSGKATVTIAITRGGAAYASLGTPGAVSAKGEPQSLGYALPADIAGQLGYCVTAKDAAGNASAPACGAITVAAAATPATTTAGPGADTVAPYVKPMPAQATRVPGTITLRWFARDAGGSASFIVTVKRGTQTVGTLAAERVKLPVAGLLVARRFTYRWSAPQSLTWCVVALDRAGNRSAPACSTLTLH